MTTEREEQLQDSQLVRRILAGRRDDYTLLVRRHQDRVYSLIMRQIGDPQLSRELAQDTFVRAYSGLRGFRHEARFDTWLIRIALNVTRSYFASRRFRERERTVTLEPDIHGGAVEMDAGGEEETALRLRRAIAKLKPKYRDVLVLCTMESRTYKEAAEILGLPVGTVCSRMNTALAELRRIMQRLGGR